MEPFSIPPYQVDPATLPPVIMTSEPGSFAQRTLAVRVPRIAEETIQANHFPPDVAAALAALRAEIVDGRVRLLEEPAADRAFWDPTCRPFAGRTWLDVPWYWAEAYFYRRVLEATGYFQPGAGRGRDPFAVIKRSEWRPEVAPQAVERMLAALPEDDAGRFAALVAASLWGNQIDLSYKVSVEMARAGGAHDGSHLLVDDTPAVWELLLRHAAAQVVILADNAGTECLMDLALVDFLLERNLAGRVDYHVKAQPFFVSDTTGPDLDEGLAALPGGGERCTALASRIAGYRQADRLRVRTHWAYTTSLFFFQLPAGLRGELAAAGLVVLKGDANYRRLLGDAHWPFTTPFATAAGYFPAPLVTLRTLKSEVMVGLAPGAAERLAAEDADWLVNGKRGVIQARL